MNFAFRPKGHSSFLVRLAAEKCSTETFCCMCPFFVHFALVAVAVARLRLISKNAIGFNFTGNKI